MVEQDDGLNADACGSVGSFPSEGRLQDLATQLQVLRLHKRHVQISSPVPHACASSLVHRHCVPCRRMKNELRIWSRSWTSRKRRRCRKELQWYANTTSSDARNGRETLRDSMRATRPRIANNAESANWRLTAGMSQQRTVGREGLDAKNASRSASGRRSWPRKPATLRTRDLLEMQRPWQVAKEKWSR